MAAVLRTVLRVLLGALLSVVWAVGAPAAVGDEPAAVSSKALKYHEALRKRLEPGYLYDRFYNTWLDEATVDDVQKFLRAKANESNDTSDLLLLAYFYAKQGDDSAALEEFRRALADNPGSAEAWYQKAGVEARTLDFDTAIADLRKAREQNPDEKLSVLIDKQLGRLLVRTRQTDEATKVWSDMLAANPGDDDLAEDLSELHIDEGLFEQAAKLAEALLSRTSDPYLAVTRRLRLGDVYQRAGNRELDDNPPLASPLSQRIPAESKSARGPREDQGGRHSWRRRRRPACRTAAFDCVLRLLRSAGLSVGRHPAATNLICRAPADGTQR